MAERKRAWPLVGVPDGDRVAQRWQQLDIGFLAGVGADVFCDDCVGVDRQVPTVLLGGAAGQDEHVLAVGEQIGHRWPW